MGIFDRFLDSVRLNDDYDDDDDSFFDDEDDFEEVDEKPRKKLFGRKNKESEEDDFDDYDDDDRHSYSSPSYSSSSKTSSRSGSSTQQRYTSSAVRSTSSKVTPMRRRNNAPSSGMEVCVIKPSRVEDYREIADTLLSGCTVVLNLEGIDVELAQRIIDFSSGSCYAIGGGLQKVSSYIFILTPSNVEISGDIQDLLGDSVPSVSAAY
ncbi:MAG: cell division protein SepF [Eubacteriales bacterium]|jgi:cell division inhibitor SepF